MKKIKNILLVTIILLLSGCTMITNDVVNGLYKKTHPNAPAYKDKISIKKTVEECNRVKNWCNPSHFNEYGSVEEDSYYCVCYY